MSTTISIPAVTLNAFGALRDYPEHFENQSFLIQIKVNQKLVWYSVKVAESKVTEAIPEDELNPHAMKDFLESIHSNVIEVVNDTLKR